MGAARGPRQITYYAASGRPLPTIRPHGADLKTKGGGGNLAPRYHGRFTPEKDRACRPAFQRPSMTARAAFSWLFALISALMLGLAAGAVWMVPTLYLQRPLPWLAALAGWLLGKAMRQWVRPAGAGAAWLAALATLTAALYVNLLTAAARIAGLMGLGLVDTLRTAGFGLLLHLSELGNAPGDDVWYALGMGLAALAAARPARGADR